MTTQEIIEGLKVHYTSPHGSRENGMVKSISEDGMSAFVVFHCDNDWENFRDYTGQHTKMKDLSPGWYNNQNK